MNLISSNFIFSPCLYILFPCCLFTLIYLVEHRKTNVPTKPEQPFIADISVRLSCKVAVFAISWTRQCHPSIEPSPLLSDSRGVNSIIRVDTMVFFSSAYVRATHQGASLCDLYSTNLYTVKYLTSRVLACPDYLFLWVKS